MGPAIEGARPILSLPAPPRAEPAMLLILAPKPSLRQNILRKVPPVGAGALGVWGVGV